MPLVTQLREGVHPLVFPTDLSIDKQNAVGANADRQSSPGNNSPPPPNDVGGGEGVNASSTPQNSAVIKRESGAGKLKHLSQEEARQLMLKAAAEKQAAAANNSGNLSDNSYGGDDNGNLSGGDYHAALSAGAGAFADVGAAAGLNLNILNSISAMNSLIGGGGGSAGGNGGLSMGSLAGLGIGSPGGAGNGSGHPCPECGRLYKLKSSLRNHQKWECGKEPQFQCPFCVYRAKQKMHIGRHMERMHKEKFIKLEDLKSYATGGGLSGMGADDNSNSALSAAAVAAAAALANANELRQHFS